jgi:hypothetical protein
MTAWKKQRQKKSQEETEPKYYNKIEFKIPVK